MCQERKRSWTVIKVVETPRRGAASSPDRYNPSINREDLGELCLFPQVSAAVSAYIDGDLAGFRLIGFRHLYFEYAIAIIGANRIRLHGLR